MEKKIVVTKRFRNNTFQVYQYLLQNFSSNVAFLFLDKIEERIDLISKHPTIGRPSRKRQHIRSIILTPNNMLFYRTQKNKIEILCLFDTRRNPKKKPY